MKRISTLTTKWFLAYWFFATAGYSFAQKADSTNSFSFSLQQATDYAMQNHPKIQNALIDEQMAKDKVREVMGYGFPQINGSIDAKDFLQIPTTFIPGEFFGAPAGTYLPVKFGTQYNASAGFDGSQMLFSSDYFIGIQASKVYRELSQKSTTRTKTEILASVQKAYYSALVNEERMKLLDANVSRIGKLKDDTKAIYENGFAEKLDYDRIVLVYNNLVIEKEKITRFVDLSYTLLKYQMGMDQNTKLILSNSLDSMKFDIPELKAEKFDYSKRIEFSILESQLRMNQVQLKKDKYAYLPNASLYASFSTQASRTAFNFFDDDKGWYPVSLVGVRIGVPVFDGFIKHYRIQQSKLNVQKTQNDLNFVKQSIDLELASARTSLLNNASSLESQKKNMELARDVYDVTKTKYEEGVGTNIEVLNAETSLKESQTNYFSALFDALVAKVDFEKASGQLTK